MGLFLARLGAGADDFSQLLPFLVRTWMYTSGVMFSIQTIKTLTGHPTLTYLLQINPAAVYISLARNAILTSQRNAWPGSKPYNAANCALYHSATAANAKGSVLEFSAYCHGTVTMNGLWLWGIGWAVAGPVGRVRVLLGSGNEVRPWLSCRRRDAFRPAPAALVNRP